MLLSNPQDVFTKGDALPAELAVKPKFNSELTRSSGRDLGVPLSTRNNFEFNDKSLGKLFEPETLSKESYPQNNNNNDSLGEFLNLFPIKVFIPEAAHFLSIIGNGTAAVANIFNLNDGVKKFADNFGRVGTKIFLVLNGMINSLEYFHKKNFLGAIGHAIDIFVGSFSSHDHTYLDRGNAVGLYTYANTLCNMNGRDRFKSFSDHAAHLREGLNKSVKNVFSKDFFANFGDANKGMFGIFSGVLCNLGSIVWHITGNEKLGTVIRDFGGFLVDLEQAHPGHWNAGRKFYFASGLGLIGGTVCDLLSKLLPYYKKSLVPLSLAIDGFGRYLLRMSHNRNELGKTQQVPVAMAA